MTIPSARVARPHVRRASVISAVLVALAAWVGASQAASSRVPALTADHPTVTVVPDRVLDGEVVAVRVTGFGVGGKVWLSECDSLRDASALGCGTQLAAMALLVTDNQRSGTGPFTVQASAATGAGPQGAAHRKPCLSSCVIVATEGGGLGWKAAPISFAPSGTPLCASSALSASFFGQGATQSLLGEITIRSHARAACRLVGRAAISVRSAPPREALQQRVMNTAAMFPSVPFTPKFLLQPGDTVTARFQWWNWCNPRTPPGTPPGSNSAQGPKPTGIAVTLRTGVNPINATVPGSLGSLAPPICMNPSAPASWITVSLWTTP
jgi:Protein of unknown function (DUF4232)